MSSRNSQRTRHRLLTKLYGKEIEAKEDMSLADIYYYEEDSYENAPVAKIGFDTK